MKTIQNEGIQNQKNEAILRELLNTIPGARLGFPTPEELRHRKDELFAAHLRRMERREKENEAEFLKLKQAALANLRKDRP
jgi:hypothetical protein